MICYAPPDGSCEDSGAYGPMSGALKLASFTGS